MTTLCTSLRFDHAFLSVEQEHRIHCMLELTAPPIPHDRQRPPLHLALVIDRSGSMSGAKLETAKRAGAYLAHRLRSDDQLSIVAYDDEVTLVHGLAPVGADQHLVEASIRSIRRGGQTNLSGGWLKGLEQLGAVDAGAGPKKVLLLSDGLANVGITNRSELAKLAHGAADDGVGTTTIGFGDGFDEDLMTAMANEGGGSAYFAPGVDDVPGIFAEEFDDLVALVARVLGTAPRLADTLAQHPQVLDPLVDTAFFGVLPGPDRLSQSLARSLEQAGAYEDFLDRVRLFGQEQIFLIGARILSGTVSAQQAGFAFAAIADAILRALHARVAEMLRAAHGAVPGGDAAVLAMGKLGGREMTANSDLDLIVVYDLDPAHPDSDGPRPLHGAQYFARFTQRLINALTTPTNYGRLYDVDMRLRPSGRSGPVATSLAAFENYQHNEAWTWEHMALTRARVASSSPALAARVATVIREVLRAPREAAAVAADVVEMRRAIAAEKGAAAPWDLKYAAGGEGRRRALGP
jgi:phenylpyruvate tautomerase PptA (4-oxalocrotonate tautomerase family)